MTTDLRFKRTWGPTPRYPNVMAFKRKGYPEGPIVIAGPCSIECEEQVETVAAELSRVGCTYMRGGVFRAGTYPPPNFGLQKGLLKTWSAIAKKHHLKIIVEVIDVRQLDYLDQYADAFQVGARQGQGYVLLSELAKTSKVVTLKRNPGMTLDEFLGAAEYLTTGPCRPLLIERGSATHGNHTRWTLDLGLIARVKTITQMPILVDASHGTGARDLVRPLTLAGMQAGADGFLVEVHPHPEKSISDADQAYPLEKYADLVSDAEHIYWEDELCL